MNDITVLTSTSSTSNALTAAANNIITNYDLRFSVEDILSAFKRLRLQYIPRWPHHTIYLTLTTNLRMFIAIMYAAIDNKMPCQMWILYLACICPRLGLQLGWKQIYGSNLAAQVYCALHDYYEFDITALLLSNAIREQLQQHIDSKRTYTKRATSYVTSLSNQKMK